MKLKYKTQTKQGYWAGALTAKLYNLFYTRTDLPSIAKCMRDFTILRTLFGRYYGQMKNSKLGNPFIVKYEEFDHLNLDQTLVGDYRDFMLGYSDFINRPKLWTR